MRGSVGGVRWYRNSSLPEQPAYDVRYCHKCKYAGRTTKMSVVTRLDTKITAKYRIPVGQHYLVRADIRESRTDHPARRFAEERMRYRQPCYGKGRWSCTRLQRTHNCLQGDHQNNEYDTVCETIHTKYQFGHPSVDYACATTHDQGGLDG